MLYLRLCAPSPLNFIGSSRLRAACGETLAALPSAALKLRAKRATKAPSAFWRRLAFLPPGTIAWRLSAAYAFLPPLRVSSPLVAWFSS